MKDHVLGKTIFHGRMGKYKVIYFDIAATIEYV